MHVFDAAFLMSQIRLLRLTKHETRRRMSFGAPLKIFNALKIDIGPRSITIRTAGLKRWRLCFFSINFQVTLVCASHFVTSFGGVTHTNFYCPLWNQMVWMVRGKYLIAGQIFAENLSLALTMLNAFQIPHLICFDYLLRTPHEIGSVGW